jgi:hypothetical protein
MEKNKSFAELREATTFNWNEFLSRDEYTTNDMYSAISYSSKWVTCAVGTQCATIPRDKDGFPMDDQLRYLGQSFYRHIRFMFEAYEVLDKDQMRLNRNDAKDVLCKIEVRSQHILNEMNPIKKRK